MTYAMVMLRSLLCPIFGLAQDFGGVVVSLWCDRLPPGRRQSSGHGWRKACHTKAISPLLHGTDPM